MFLRIGQRVNFLIVIVLLLLATTVSFTSAQERIVGVNVGDWFRYGDFSVSWSSNDPWNPTFPPLGREQLGWIDETEWMLVSVQNISHTIITFHVIKHYKNGTEKIEEGYVDIDSGTGNMSLRAISANLGVNDTVYTSGPYSLVKINETISRTYLDSTRETNHLNMTRIMTITRYENDSALNGTSFENWNYYWDKPTGIFVELSLDQIEQVEEYSTNMSISYRLIESNIWAVPELTTWAPICLLLIILTIAAVYKRIDGNSRLPPKRNTEMLF